MRRHCTDQMLCHNPTFSRFMSSYPADTQLYGGLGLVLTTLLLLALARWMARTEATLTRRQKRQLLDKQEFVRWNMLLYRTDIFVYQHSNNFQECG